jgi:hypothetical protein
MKRAWGGLLFLLLAAGALAAEVPRPEHPRPDFQRAAWQNLNGEWGFAFDEKDRGLAERWFQRASLPQKILVPYPVESELSGIGDTRPPEVVWYARTFNLDEKLLRPAGDRSRILLHFGAVDYEARVWLNGNGVGDHFGGYTPFVIDVTDMVKDEGNLLAVRVRDSRDPMQVRGKQTTTGKSYSIFYTTVTGIWQTVWLEKAGAAYIHNFLFTPARELDGGVFTLTLRPEPAPGLAADIVITGPDGAVETVRWSGGPARWTARAPRRWSPADPALYDVELRLRNADGAVIDSVKSYVGIRTIAARDGQVLLNGQPFYQKLLLDQGYFPGGVYTPKDDAIMRADVEMYRRMGFNGLRKHQKIEDPRFLYWCDRLGLVVWEELPSAGTVTPLHPPKRARSQALAEWREAIARDRNHPCIVTWTVFNENWGIQEPSGLRLDPVNRRWADVMIRATRDADPTRLVVDNSGGYHFDTDVWDFHHYLSTAERSVWLYRQYDLKPGDYRGPIWSAWAAGRGVGVIPGFSTGVRYGGQPIVVSEYGGFGFYRTEGEQSLLDKYRDYTLAMKDFPYLDGYCYTQPYDVEQEKNGLMTFERVPKVDPEEIKKINDQLGESKK